MLVKMDKPDLYVISPFREVIAQVQRLLLNDKELKEIFKMNFRALPFSDWLRQAIGTVHTFQGKQASTVFFVLGADKSSLGAIEWASRKPNLLNVAVTRAQSRFYMIGDYDLWRKWPYFDVAAKKLKRCSLSDFHTGFV
jgi:superfamily I DNA and/or RNA helicase